MPEGKVVFQSAVFKKGAYILIEDRMDFENFYIIRKGQVVETRSASVLAEDRATHLGIGDFFGVISCMAMRPRIETVQAEEDTSVIVVRRDLFGALIQKNTPIAMKILRYFGKQLRYYDSQVTKLSFKSSIEEDPNYLFNIGEYYQKIEHPVHAAYAYHRYMQSCPDGGYVPQAKQRFQQLGVSQEKLKPVKNGFLFSFSDNQIVFLEHEPGAELYLIQEGQVKITKIVNDNEVLLAVLKKGDIFGEMSLLDNKPRSASAIAYGGATLMAVTKANFEPTVKAHPEIATRIIQLLSERIWVIYKQLSNLLIKDNSSKILDALYTQLQKNRLNVKERLSYTFEFGKNELIKFVGFTPEEGQVHFRNFLSKYTVFTEKEGKIYCKDISMVEKYMNSVKRSLELERKKMNR